MINAGGCARRSASSSLNRSLSDNMSVLVERFRWEADANGAAGRVVFKQSVLVRQKKKVLHITGVEQEEFPVRVTKQRTADGSRCAKAKGQIGKSGNRQSEAGKAFLGAAFEYPEVSKCGQKALGYFLRHAR